LAPKVTEKKKKQRCYFCTKNENIKSPGNNKVGQLNVQNLLELVKSIQPGTTSYILKFNLFLNNNIKFYGKTFYIFLSNES